MGFSFRLAQYPGLATSPSLLDIAIISTSRRFCRPLWTLGQITCSRAHCQSLSTSSSNAECVEWGVVTSNLYIPDMPWIELMHAPAGTATLSHGFGRDGRQFGMKRYAIVWMTALPHLRTLEPYRALLDRCCHQRRQTYKQE